MRKFLAGLAFEVPKGAVETVSVSEIDATLLRITHGWIGQPLGEGVLQRDRTTHGGLCGLVRWDQRLSRFQPGWQTLRLAGSRYLLLVFWFPS